MRAVSAASASRRSSWSSRHRTKAEPTITPSAYDATSAACAPLLTPSPTPDRQVGHLAGAGDEGGGEVAGRGAGTGHAHHGGRVDEAAARGGGHRDPLVGRGGRHQEDLVEVVGVCRRDPAAGTVGREVRRDQPGAACRDEVGGEAFDAVPLDGVPVGHDHRRRTGRRHRLDGAEHVADPHSPLQRALGCGLDRRAVHHRVAVGQADLDHVTTGLDHRAHRLDAAVHVGEAGREVADQGRAVVGAGLLEGRGDRHPTGSASPPSASPRWNHSIAVPMSLSPRPERLISMMSSAS